MPLEEIRKEIESGAHAEANEVKRSAQHEAGEIVKKAEEQAKAIVHAAESEAKAESARRRMELKASIEVEAHNVALQAKEQVLEREMKRINSRIAREIGSKKLRELYSAALKKFAEGVSMDQVVVRTNKNSATLVDKKLRVEFANVDGFVFRSADGKVSLTAAPDKVVEENADLIKSTSAANIFGAERKDTRHAAPKAMAHAKVAKRPMKKAAKKAPAKAAMKKKR